MFWKKKNKSQKEYSPERIGRGLVGQVFSTEGFIDDLKKSFKNKVSSHELVRIEYELIYLRTFLVFFTIYTSSRNDVDKKIIINEFNKGSKLFIDLLEKDSSESADYFRSNLNQRLDSYNNSLIDNKDDNPLPSLVYQFIKHLSGSGEINKEQYSNFYNPAFSEVNSFIISSSSFIRSDI